MIAAQNRGRQFRRDELRADVGRANRNIIKQLFQISKESEKRKRQQKQQLQAQRKSLHPVLAKTGAPFHATRRREEDRIRQEENHRIANKLLAVKPSMNMGKLVSDHKRHQKTAKRLRQVHPLPKMPSSGKVAALSAGHHNGYEEVEAHL